MFETEGRGSPLVISKAIGLWQAAGVRAFPAGTKEASVRRCGAGPRLCATGQSRRERRPSRHSCRR